MMKEDVICKFCKKCLCCANCRHTHELKKHAIRAKETKMIMNDVGKEIPIRKTIYMLCPLCAGKPLALLENISREMLQHIEKHHLPLNCMKCSKLYTKIEDLDEFSKCASSYCDDRDDAADSQTFETDSSKITVTRAPTSSTISTQTSPMTASSNGTETQSLGVNLEMWETNRKVTHEEFTGDSVSSLKNISSINSSSSIRRSLNLTTVGKGKLVRSTSTPVQFEMILAKPKDPAFNASGPQVSSIYNNSCEHGHTPSTGLPESTPPIPRPQFETVNRYRKIAGRPKISAVTPLRQVMSKSIQKAFAEHGGLPPSDVYKGETAEGADEVEESMDGGRVLPSSSGGVGNSSEAPLDLRLSPVVRRSRAYSESHAIFALGGNGGGKISQVRREILLSAQKVTTESIVITRTQHLTAAASSSSSILTTAQQDDGNDGDSKPNNLLTPGNSEGSIYKTCHSVEIITSTEMLTNSDVNLLQPMPPRPSRLVADDCVAPGITPKCVFPGAMINKKLIKFDTPNVKTGIYAADSPSSDREEFFTPNTTPVSKSEFLGSDCKSRKGVPRNLSGHFSPSRRPPLRLSSQTSSFDQGTAQPKQAKQSHQTPDGEPWSLSTFINRVILMPVLKKSSQKNENSSQKLEDNSSSILRRCALMAGSLVRSKPLSNDEQLKSLKRKRAYTAEFDSNIGSSAPSSPKRFRIQARRPIRHNFD